MSRLLYGGTACYDRLHVMVCRCCRLPVSRPRRLWCVVMPERRKPRLVALCAGCYEWLLAGARSVVGWGEVKLLVVGEAEYNGRRKKAGTLESSGRGARGG